MTNPDPSLRHVPRLVDASADGEPVYRCQLCRRQGALGALLGEECPGRSAVQRRILLGGGPAKEPEPGTR